MFAQYLNIAIGGVFALCVLAFAVGSRVGRVTQQGTPTEKGLILFCVALSSALIIGSILLGNKIGPAALFTGVAFDTALWIALLSGLNLGRRRLNTPPAIVAVFLVVVLLLGFVRSKGLELASAANELGIGNAQTKDEPKDRQTCAENLKSLYTAFSFYAQDWDALPLAKGWMENKDFASKVTKDGWLHCPVVSNGTDGKFGYAYNAHLAGKTLGLSGKPLSAMPNSATTPLVYDSSDLAQSASDANASLPKPGRHGGKNYILYCDGSVKAVAQ